MTGVPVDAVWQQENGRRQQELRRMRLVAASLLILMLVLFIAASAMVDAWPWLAYPRAFAEAAMVGACADWFAVVALFRHPLGIPIPHTAIVPQHKKRIGENLGLFISSNFLAPTEVTERLRSIDAAGWVAGWIKEPANARMVASRLQGLFPPMLDVLGEDQLQTFYRGLIRDGIDSIAAAPLAARMLSVMIANGYHDKAFDLAIDAAQDFLNAHEQSIYQRVARNSVRWLPGWVNSKPTEALLAELQENLAAARAGDHPWRTAYRIAVDRLLTRLADDPEMLERCERIKAEVLDDTVVESYLAWLGGEIEVKMQTEFANQDGVVPSGLEHTLLALGNWLENDAEIRALINRWTQQVVLNTVVPNRAEIGAFVAEVVARWDTTTLVDKLELQVGKDLQYIRINGTVVGGLVGLIIFTTARMFG